MEVKDTGNLGVGTLASLLDQSNLHYQSLDPEGRIIKVNNKWLFTLGYNEAEVLNRYFADFLTEESRKTFEERFKECLKEGPDKSTELSIYNKDKTVMCCEFTSIGEFSSTGNLIATHCVFQNLTRLKDLQENEKKLEEIIELTNVGIFEFDVIQQKFLYVNSVIKEALLKENQDNEMPSLTNFLSDEYREIHQKKMQDLVEGKKVNPISEYRIKGYDGKERDIQITNTFIRDKEGIRIIGVVHDITERKNLENELKEFQERHEAIVKNLATVLFQIKVSRKNLDLLYVSEKVKDIIGYTEEEIRQNPELIFSLPGKKENIRVSRQLRNPGNQNKTLKIKLKIKTRDGGIKWIQNILTSRIQNDNSIIWTGVSYDITEETDLREQLSFTEKRYQALINSASPAITMMSKKGFVTSINARLCELSGYSEKDFIGKHFLNIPPFYLKDLPKYLKLYQDALRNEIPSDPVLFEWKHKSGEKRFAEAYLSSIREDGEITGFQSIMLDVTERVKARELEEKKNEEANQLLDFAIQLLSLEDENKLFSLLADELQKLLPGSIINIDEFDAEKSIVTVRELRMENKSLISKVTGLIGRQFEGMQFPIEEGAYDYTKASRLVQQFDSIYDLSFHKIPKAISDQIEKMLGIESHYLITLGNNRDIYGGAVIFLREGQQINCIQHIETLFREASNALSRIRIHKALNNSEKLYKSLAESAGEWILRFDSGLRHIYINHALENDFNISKISIIGKTCLEAGYSKEHSQLIESHLMEALRTNKPSHCDIEMQLNKNSQFFEWRFYPELLSKEEKTILVFARNVTTRKAIEGQLIDSIANKNRLYSIITHDLRSPFNSMIGFLDILSDDFGSLSDEKKLKFIELVRSTAKDSYNLLDSILQWSVGNEEGDKAKPVYFDLGLLINKTIEFYKAPLTENHLEIAVQNKDHILVYADYNMIFTVLRNLLSNAIKYSGQGGIIEINVMEKADIIHCEVRDYGIGISDKNKDSFSAGEKLEIIEGSDGTKGYGLGLKLVNEFIKYNHGKIWLEKKASGGTSFTFTLNKKPKKKDTDRLNNSTDSL